MGPIDSGVLESNYREDYSVAIKKIKIENFKCFNGVFELELNKGLNILVGNSETGKSTIVEAIHVTLTGMYSAGTNVSDARMVKRLPGHQCFRLLSLAATHHLFLIGIKIHTILYSKKGYCTFQNIRRRGRIIDNKVIFRTGATYIEQFFCSV